MVLVVSVIAFEMEVSEAPTLGMAAVLSMIEEEGVRVEMVASSRLLALGYDERDV